MESTVVKRSPTLTPLTAFEVAIVVAIEVFFNGVPPFFFVRVLDGGFSPPPRLVGLAWLITGSLSTMR